MRKAAALLALGAMALGAQPSVNATPTQMQQKVTDQQKPVENKQIETVSKINPLGGYERKYFSDYGTPPKIYGMFYAKRGTHKRTNK